jgi:4-aminobutyrate aminotransferase / (S)-3-amino-2-methylpropionate transaminase / 5-aminovalerate transaminase
MPFSFQKKSIDVEFIETKHRKISSNFFPNASLDILESLEKHEPSSMNHELPLIWNKAKGYQIFDNAGNIWIDFSSGIFVTNIGHAHPTVKKAIIDTVNNDLLHNYYFPSEIRSKLTKKLIDITPSHLDKVFLLTTGAEATECALKLSRIYGKKQDPKKIGILCFEGAMHGKTLGALMMSGKPKEKYWVENLDPNIYHIPFPYDKTCPWNENNFHQCSANCFKKSLDELENKGVDLSTISSVMIESYQGWGAMFYPIDYIQAVKKWAEENHSLIIFDEIQAGFGRTGKLFAFEHYGIEPDLICCGKGISSSLPLSCVIGRKEIVDVDPSLNSTHGGNPICCAATLASIDVLFSENLVEKASKSGNILENELKQLQNNYPEIIYDICGKGLVYAIHIIDPLENKLDVDFVDRVIEKCLHKGLLLIRTSSGTIKIGPPLTIPDTALKEGVEIINESILECINQQKITDNYKEKL